MKKLILAVVLFFAAAAPLAVLADSVNINTATAEQLEALPGIGPSKAAAIVKDRETNGPFGSVADLARVSGIGDQTVANLGTQIAVD